MFDDLKPNVLINLVLIKKKCIQPCFNQDQDDDNEIAMRKGPTDKRIYAGMGASSTQG